MKLKLSDLAKHGVALLRQHEGPLTEELSRRPGGFGLGQLPEHLVPERTVTSVCGYCATGCGLRIHIKDGAPVNLSPDSEYPVNRGMACPKGWEALTPMAADDRATTPLLRGASGALEPVGWDEAMRKFAGRFRGIQDRHGPDSLAFLSTGQIPTEEMLFLGALAKFGMGIRHGDGNTRQCMATAATAYKESFGFDAPPYTYQDFEESDVIVLVGSNLCIAHPILWERICRNPNDPEIVVVDPRHTETAAASTQHYAIRPKSDLAFFYAIAQVLIERGWVDREFIAAHTEDYEGFAKHVAAFRPESVAAEAGISADAIRRFAETIHSGKRVSFWWTMGVNQSHEAVRTAQALIALSLLTGSIGRPGTGANSITGQCNAMGSRLFSNTTSLPGGRDFADPHQRAKVAGMLGIPEAQIPPEAGWAYDQIVEGVRDGRIKGLWVIATNGAHSWIHQSDFLDALGKLEFLVVQDLYPDTATARLADLVLPAAGWSEKEGTFINSERRIGMTQKVHPAPGKALADFHIFRLLAEAWGCADWFSSWKTPEDVFDTMKELSRGQPCDIAGIGGYRRLDELGGIQWPVPEGQEPGASERRLFEDGVFPRANGRALFCYEAPRPVPEATDDDYPFALLTGRGSSSQWHTGTRTERSPVLRKLAPEAAYVEIHPADAERLGIAPEETVRIHSRRGAIEARAAVGTVVAEGTLFVPMHYDGVNRLTHPSFDPYSRQPSFKHCAVRIERIPREG